MKLKILLPSRVLFEKEVSKIIAEAENGSFCILPSHIDYVATLVPGLLQFDSEESGEEFAAVDSGVLVKEGDRVLVSTQHAVYGGNLGSLQQTVEDSFKVLDDRDRAARSAVAKLEASFIRNFMDVENA